MKKLIPLLLTLCFLSDVFAQGVTCADFTVTDISQDTVTPGVYQVGISFDAAANTFINYPMVTAVLDCNGDTVAAGSMFWFGQLGQTEQDYPVSLSGSLNCMPLTIVFTYGDDVWGNDTCSFAFAGTGVSLSDVVEPQVRVFPNPVRDAFSMSVDDESIGSFYILYDFLGQAVLSGMIQNPTTDIRLGHLPSGVYFLAVGQQQRIVRKVIKS